jgi:putative ABC transport system permease protein
MRNPRRTAGTATALMVGVGVVTLFMVFGASLDASVSDTVARSIQADLVVQSDSFSGAGLSPELAPRLAQVSGVEHAVSLGSGEVSIGGKAQEIDFGEPKSIPGVLDLSVAQGSIGDLRTDQLAVSTGYAQDHHLEMGSAVPMRFVDGTRASPTVGAVYRNKDFADAMVLPTAAYAPHAPRPTIVFVMVRNAPGADLTAVRHAVDQAGHSLGAPKSLTRQGFVDKASGKISSILSIVYVMLALSILIAVMGIANTLSLSIHERIRELGLLRAVGQTRPQTRAMIRWEAVVISLFGTLAGVAVGVLLGWSLVKGAASDSGIGVFSAPISRMIVIVVLGGLVGILAGLRPARRAARIDVLQAIATT